MINDIHRSTLESFIMLFFILSAYWLGVVFYDMDEGYTTILIYGTLVPLVVRQALDLKSVFYHKLQYSLSIKEDVSIFITTLKWLSFILIPVIIVLFFSSIFISYSFLASIIEAIHKQFNDLIGIFTIYILILPIYIIWDMLYRIYYKNKFLNKLFIIMFSGVLLNIGLNYISINYFEMHASGIALSIFIVLLAYYIYATRLLYVELNKNYILEGTNENTYI